MEEAQSNLIYFDKHRVPFNLTVIFALGVAAFGLWTMFSGGEGAIRPEAIVLLGLGTAIYSWLTNARVYLIYSDALFIIYGRPRIKKLPFSDISYLEMRQLNTPDRLRVWPVKGRRVVLMARDPDKFHDELQQALNDFRVANPEFQIYEPQDDSGNGSSPDR